MTVKLQNKNDLIINYIAKLSIQSDGILHCMLDQLETTSTKLHKPGQQKIRGDEVPKDSEHKGEVKRIYTNLSNLRRKFSEFQNMDNLYGNVNLVFYNSHS